jgi:dihydrofolate reductase
MISIIVAFSRNRVIGCGGKIPWDIPADRERFRKLTVGNAVIMGRRTFEEIGRPLSERYNIIVSNTADYKGDTICTVRSLNEAVGIAENMHKDIFLCGGEKIYREGIKLADFLYLTEIDEYFDGDAFFPVLNDDFVIESKETVHGRYTYTNFTYRRK